MRRAPEPRSMTGWLCLVAMLALSSPGVNTVQAKDTLVSEAAPGPTCAASRSSVPTGDVWSLLAKAQAQGAPELPAAAPQPGQDIPVSLNTRGYNYGPSDAERMRQLQQLRPSQ